MRLPCNCGHHCTAHTRNGACAVQWCSCLQMRKLKPREYRYLLAWVARVLSRCAPEPESDCIRWIGYTNILNGYGQCRVSPHYAGLDTNGKRPKVVGAHRVLYSLMREKIPPTYHLDHNCGNGVSNRWCVNPYHVEPMTQTKNAQLGNAMQWGVGRADEFEEGIL